MSPMVSCLLLVLVTVVHSGLVDHQGADISLKLSWVTETRMELKIGGRQRNIWLSPTTNIPGLKTPCLFKGKLESDPDSDISVSGCHNSNETTVSIASSLLSDGIVDLMIVDGITINKDSPSSNEIDIEGEERMGNYTADFLYPPSNTFEDTLPLWSGPLPAKVAMKTNIIYDNSLLEHFDNSHKKTKDWLNRVVDLVKLWMSHKSLTIRVALEIGEVSHVDETLEASVETIKYLRLKYHKTLTSYFCKDIGGGIAGTAYMRTACNSWGYALNIVELSSMTNSLLKTAQTFAHELGHNIGMEHDFEKKHGGYQGRCNHQGLMSYGKRPNKWSTCSDSDFKTWWKKEGHACLIETRDKQYGGPVPDSDEWGNLEDLLGVDSLRP